jgi:hypothetical protein
MRKLVYLSLQNNVAQRVVSLWRPKLYRTDDTVGSGGGVAHAGAAACSRRERPRAGQTGPEVGILAPGRAIPGPRRGSVGCAVSGQVSGRPVRAGKLKNWKSDKLTPRPATRVTRIPGFHVLTCPQMHGPGAGNSERLFSGAESTFPGHRKHCLCSVPVKRLSANAICHSRESCEGQGLSAAFLSDNRSSDIQCLAYYLNYLQHQALWPRKIICHRLRRPSAAS